MGRNRKPDNLKKYSMTFALTYEDSDKIDSVAKALSISRSSAVSLAIKLFDTQLIRLENNNLMKGE